jgi:non-specific serine/threonine protein kinase
VSDVTLDSFTTFGELLRYLRRRARLTQRELGLAVGYSEAQVNRLESGQRLPDVLAVKTTFVDALGLQREPQAARRLLALAEQAARKSAGATAGSTAESAPPTNLPAQLTSFVGREQELTEVKRLLGTTRLLTLTGSGGCGKTRLAQEVASRAWGDYPDGVWLAELAPLAEPPLVADAVATALGLHPVGQPATSLLKDYLRDKEALLVLDNCEHLVQTCAELAEVLLRGCPRLRILATSREALDVPGEVPWRVPPMAAGEASQLFAERARTAKPGFVLTEQNTALVTHICEHLDGIPLAIELAAARLRSFSVGQVAARLDDRFCLLTGGARTALPRHQTLRATVEWSYGLLSGDEQRLLRRLSAFAGGWEADAAVGVWGDAEALELLDQLVSKSLVQVDDGPVEPRYRLLETIRQYAHEKLAEAGEHEQAHRRHAGYFADLAQAAKPHLRGPQQYAWFDRLEADLDNLRAALAWAAQGGGWQTAERLIDGVFWFWFRCGHAAEGQRWIDATLLRPAGVAVHAQAFGKLVWAGLDTGSGSGYEDAATARALAEEALQASHGLGDEWLSLNAEFMAATLDPDLEQRVTRLQDAVRHAQRLGWKWEEALILGMLSWSLAQVDTRQAESAVTRALQLFTELGDRSHVAWLQRELGRLALRRGDYLTARQRLEESLAAYRGTRDHGLAVGQSMLAAVAVLQGDTATARRALQECMPTFVRWGSHQAMGESLVLAGRVAQVGSQSAQAIRALAAVTAYYDARGVALLSDVNVFVPPLYERCLAALRASVDAVTFDHEWAEGERMTLEQAVAYALQEGEADESPVHGRVS